MGDAEYLAAFKQIILPIAYQFNPQLVLVAAGFDAAQGDPLGGSSYNSNSNSEIKSSKFFFVVVIFNMKGARLPRKDMDK